ncbi:peptidase M56 [Myxococcus llanfairpwllgwyngyllgogerychwyrndrobwllllantysiliogogogochensis]|uniref:Peptidase M56 n=1 Tax=Myxococcus llanfairpwllgwyngyllgogerychwyrndrobwllllantysiliogogogochensis TaxID=2590453 RepID=A0A540WLR4_9BACT|nr:M56 family metallopeptidase [Myxococcus llanfairpwllgwyngyllgogerychwyrndrobwllllantysiliogogogochensis]TQF09945.1 peptidase M56 [Myxococcus llanfairpwllgwyngyllgogerychwyrndrobwllllantysiliogogogochensis]
MRTEWLMDGATWLASWPEGLWRASWQGALCAALVWAVTRLWTRMPASLRAGMWWLVALKFVVSLGGPRPLALPVLPASLAFLSGQAESSESDGAPLVEGGAVGASPVSRGSEGWAPPIGAAHGLVGERDAHVGNLGMVGGAVHLVPVGQSTKAPGAESPRLAEGGQGARMSEAGSPNLTEGGHAIAGGLLKPSTPGARASGAGWKQFVVLALLAAWVVGVLWQVRAQVRSWALMRRLRRNARPLEHPVLESEVLELSESAGLRRAPRLLVSDEVASPLATGLWSPVVVLPTKAVRRLPVEGLRMALAHEVAHLKRGDLWLGWVPALAEALLFFHPLARRAAREYALAREEACDAEALRLTGAEPADYGELLLAFGVTRPHGTAAALGASAHVHALHRRLSMLEHVDIGSSRSRRWLKVTLSALGLVALIPFQVVARQEAKSVAETESKKGSASSTPPALTAVAETRPGGPTSTDSAQPAAVPSRKQGTVRTVPMDAAPPPAVASPVAPIAASPVGPRPVAPMAALSPTGPSPVAPMGVASPAGRSLVAPTGVASPVGLPPIAPMAVASPVGPSPVAPVGVASPVGLRPIAPMAVASASGPSPVAPRPMLSLAAPRAVPLPPRLAMAGVPAAPVAPPTPPSPPSPPDYDDDDDSSYVLLSGDKATMRGSTVDLKLAKMFKDKNGGELLYVRRKGEAFIIRDTATLAAMKAALEPIRKFGLVQGGVGTRMGALGEEQGKLGMKQGALGVQQGQLGLQHAELAHKRAGLHLQSARLDSLSEAERARREAELDKQEAELDKEIDALDAKQEELSKQQEELGREQEKLGKQQEELGREQEKLGKQHENQVRDAEKKVQSVIDEALRKGLGKPLPT